MTLSLPITTKIFFDKSSADAPYVAYCADLDISSCGSTPEKAKEMLYEAIEIVLKEAVKDGTIDEYLESAGFTKNKGDLIPPKVSFEPYLFQY